MLHSYQTIQPSAVAMLARVLDAHCRKFEINGLDARNSVGVSLISLYQAGISDEAELSRIIDGDRP